VWVKLLKWAAQAAIAAGLHKKAGEWLKRKFADAAIKKLEKLENKAENVVADLVEVEPEYAELETE
jgi:hypothetical protein